MNIPILNEKDLPLEQLREIGLVKGEDILIQSKDIHALLSGSRTNLIKLHDISRSGIEIKEMEVKLSLVRGVSGKPELLVHPVYKQSLNPPYITQAEADELITGQKSNVLKEVDWGGEKKSLLVEYDWDTREFVVTDMLKVRAPEQVNGITLSPYQKERYREGRQIELDDGTLIQASSTCAEGLRSNRLSLIISILMDGGISYVLFNGVKALIGNKGLMAQTNEKNDGYKQAFKDYEKQQLSRLGDKTFDEHLTAASAHNRGYTRSGLSR
ncbi:DUF4099 domain-containing protein [Pedobacter sp. R-06]|uniref:DUF4099 domain-containing protein n=1 Tax=Pedobacter sp. R-06 TaxID=3404051 RepID=UPI003CF07696